MFFEEEVDTPKAFKEQFTTHGRCWTFNVDGSRKVNRTGQFFGLFRILFRIFEHYFEYLNAISNILDKSIDMMIN